MGLITDQAVAALDASVQAQARSMLDDPRAFFGADAGRDFEFGRERPKVRSEGRTGDAAPLSTFGCKPDPPQST
ncbi:MAG: hypothetical protein QNJ30_19080 [Kiloniellales bacterium]|nr:hypothetical protein [Kiloniellales bacterium]